jgi:hypothetical protein
MFALRLCLYCDPASTRCVCSAAFLCVIEGAKGACKDTPDNTCATAVASERSWRTLVEGVHEDRKRCLRLPMLKKRSACRLSELSSLVKSQLFGIA